MNPAKTKNTQPFRFRIKEKLSHLKQFFAKRRINKLLKQDIDFQKLLGI
jgi:hypothetical protein